MAAACTIYSKAPGGAVEHVQHIFWTRCVSASSCVLCVCAREVFNSSLAQADPFSDSGALCRASFATLGRRLAAPRRPVDSRESMPGASFATLCDAGEAIPPADRAGSFSRSTALARAQGVGSVEPEGRAHRTELRFCLHPRASLSAAAPGVLSRLGFLAPDQATRDYGPLKTNPSAGSLGPKPPTRAGVLELVGLWPGASVGFPVLRRRGGAKSPNSEL